MTPAARSTLVALAIVVVAAALLLAMGRTPWCTCGTIRLWTSAVNSAENSQQLADPYSLTHVTHGILFYGLVTWLGRRRPLRDRAVAAIFLESAWEVIENTPFVIARYRAATLAIGYYGDSVLNSVGDIAACAVGFFLAARLPTWGSVLVVLGLEATLVLTIRDNLVLSVLMLFAPIAAVKRWQLGG